jgi:glycosyltransferase involved in cell wall biosynthesis
MSVSTNARPTISFVVPAYNEEALLPACLAAIRAEILRSGCAAEVVVVNNASTDRTAEVAAAAGVVLVHEPVKGLVAARRAGFEAASGMLIANIDADTLVPPFWIDRVHQAFARDPKLVALSGPYDYHDVALHIRAVAWAFYAMGYATYAFNKHVLGVGSMLQGGNFVVSRAALTQVGGFSDTFQFYGEDTDIARRMSRVGNVTFSFAMRAKSSGRRLRGDGVVMTGIRYSANYLWATFFRKPFTSAWHDYR